MSDIIVSIIIPCRNEELYIARCLDSLINMDFPSEKMEIIVCDGKSNDRTIEIVNTYILKYPLISLYHNEQQIAPTALNIGIKNAKGRYITRVDAHAEVYPDYLSKSLSEFEQDQHLGCVGGMLDNIYETAISRIISYAMSSGFGVGSAYFRTGNKEGYVDTLAFGTYKKEVFEKVGLFDEELVRNQDDEFNFRVTKAGFKILLKKAIKARYYVRASFKKLFRQYFQYGYWKVYVNRKHRTITTFRQLVPLFFVLFLLTGSITSFFSGLILKIFLAILSLYLVLAILSASKKSHKPGEIILIIYSFLILHCSYGLGYLNGIINFLILKRNPSEKNKQMSR